MDYNHIHLDYFEDNFSNDPDFIRSILTAFKDEVPNKIADLQDQINAKDWQEAATTSHSVKASIKMLGLELLHKEIVSIEESVRATPNKVELVEKLRNVQSVLNDAILEIEHYLHAYAQE